MLDTIKRLMASRKALVMVVAIIGVVVLAGLGRVTSEQALGFIKWVVIAFIGGTALEDAATKNRVNPYDVPAAEPVLTTITNTVTNMPKPATPVDEMGKALDLIGAKAPYTTRDMSVAAMVVDAANAGKRG